MRSFLLLCVICCAAASADGQSPAEPEAYSMVCRAREKAVRLKTPDAVARFERDARGFLTAHPASERAQKVRAWLRELRGPRVAPALDVDRWVGAAAAPDREEDAVTAVFFFSVTHPQTAWLLPRIVRLEQRRRCKGLKVVGIASVVDDHCHQAPADLAARLEELELPFPVAVDRQRATGPSVSFAAYGGRALPWVALVDRYGRLAWSGDAREPARVEREAARLLAKPSLARLAADVRAGREPLHRLATIRTKRTVTVLFDLLQEPDLRAEAAAELQSLGPKGYDLARPAAARARWRKEQAHYTYSPNADRVVRS